MSYVFAAFSYVPPMRWGSKRMWDAFDAELDRRHKEMIDRMLYSSPTKPGSITSQMFLDAFEAMEARERQLPPWFN